MAARCQGGHARNAGQTGASLQKAGRRTRCGRHRPCGPARRLSRAAAGVADRGGGGEALRKQVIILKFVVALELSTGRKWRSPRTRSLQKFSAPPLKTAVCLWVRKDFERDTGISTGTWRGKYWRNWRGLERGRIRGKPCERGDEQSFLVLSLVELNQKTGDSGNLCGYANGKRGQ